MESRVERDKEGKLRVDGKVVEIKKPSDAFLNILGIPYIEGVDDCTLLLLEPFTIVVPGFFYSLRGQIVIEFCTHDFQRGIPTVLCDFFSLQGATREFNGAALASLPFKEGDKAVLRYFLYLDEEGVWVEGLSAPQDYIFVPEIIYAQ